MSKVKMSRKRIAIDFTLYVRRSEIARDATGQSLSWTSRQLKYLNSLRETALTHDACTTGL